MNVQRVFYDCKSSHFILYLKHLKINMFFSCKALQRTVFVHSKLPPLLPISDQSILPANWFTDLPLVPHGWSPISMVANHYPHMAMKVSNSAKKKITCPAWKAKWAMHLSKCPSSKDSLPSSKTMNNDLKPQSCLAFNGRIGGPSTDACPYSCGIIRIYGFVWK